MSVIPALSVSLAAHQEKGRGGAEGRIWSSGPFPSLLASLTHVIAFLAPPVSPSFLSAPSRTLGEDSGGNTPVSPRTAPRWGEQGTQGCIPQRGAPEPVVLSPTPPLSREDTQKCPPGWHLHPPQCQQQVREGSRGHCLSPPSQRIPLHPPPQTAHRALPGHPTGTVPAQKPPPEPKFWDLCHYLRTAVSLIPSHPLSSSSPASSAPSHVPDTLITT